jgi:hypothetical protein
MEPTVTRTWRRSGLIAAALILTMLGACGDDASSQAADGVTRKDVAESPSDLIGKTVTVSGVVNEGESPDAIEIAGEGTFFDGVSVLVVGRDLPNPGTGARIEVTGVVRHFDVAEIERELDQDLELEPGSYETAIVATEVKLIDPAGTSEPPS